MRIAFVTQPGHAVLPPAGSLELWTDQVAKHLAERHEVTVYASHPSTTVEIPDWPVAYRLIDHSSRSVLLRPLRRAWRLFPATKPFFASVFYPLGYWIRVGLDARRRRHDVIHVYNYSQALPVLRLLTSAKLVLHMQCEWLTQLDAPMIERRLKHADLVVGCSDYITGLVRERFPGSASKCITIYNGVTVGRTRPNRPSSESVRLLHVGRVSPEKGLHVLLDALDQLVDDHPEIRLTILGEEAVVPYEFAVKISKDEHVRALARFYGGSYLQELRDRMSPAVAERVTFVDRVSHDETRRFYEEADIFVFPSIFEAFPIPPIEAMAASIPVVASRAGGVVESVVDGETGYLVERNDADGLAEAIRRLVEQPDLRQSFGAAGRVRAEALFSWERIVDDVEQTFASLVRLASTSTDPDGRLADL